MAVPTPSWRWLFRASACLLAISTGGFVAQHIPEPSHAAGARPVATIVEARALPEAPPRIAAADDAQRETALELEPLFEPDPGAAYMKEGRIIGGNTPHRLILFTFDDGPHHKLTPRLLDLLDAEDIKAVFFVTTERIQDQTPRNRQQAEVLREIVRRGHTLGNHSVNHIQLPTVVGEAFIHEVDHAADMIERETGHRPWMIRPPGGSRSLRVDMLLAQRGFTQVLWNLGTGDVQTDNPNVVAQTFFRVLERREREEGARGGIVLMHDIHAHSLEAFPKIVRELRQRNCALLAKGEELYEFVADARDFYAPRDGAEASVFAPAATLPPEVLERRQAAVRADAERRCSAL